MNRIKKQNKYYDSLTGLKKLLLKIVKLYQLFISPFLGHHCRFYPSCSEYCCLAIQKYGTLKGLSLGVRRLLSCHPWNRGGVDLP